MKKIYLILAAIAIVSCQSEPKINYAIISGKITNSDLENAKIYKQPNNTLAKEILLAEGGIFNDTIKLDKASFYTIYQGRNNINLYVTPGDNININYDANEIKSTLKIDGKGAVYANYLLEKSNKASDLTGEGTEIYTKEESEYKKILKDVKQTHEDLLFNYVGIFDDFKTKEKRNINYQYLSDLNKYENYHTYYAKKNGFKASDNFLTELDNLEYTNEDDFLFSSSYKGLVTSNYSKKVQDLIEKDSLLDYSITMLNVSSKIENETIKNTLLYDASQFGITFTEDLEAFYSAFIKNSTNKENNEEITKSYNALRAVAKGNTSPKFIDYENNAGGITSLDDLKGKYVYIDVWATWCGPCIAEIPSLKKIEKQYHDKNIEFVSISIDDKEDYEKWKKMIVDKELGGMQLLADNDWKSQFITDYLIKGIPRFILIDNEGNIVNSNAPRPSDSKLISLFDELKI